MNSDGEGDSRTATVGRKRQRSMEEPDVTTPADKRVRTESEDEGEIDSSHYSPSPEVHLDWDSREANQPAATRREPSESGEASGSQSPQPAEEFPHTFSAPLGAEAANGTKASYAAGLDGASDDPPGTEVASTSNGSGKPSASKSGSLSPYQAKMIDNFERRRAEQILRTPLPSTQDINHTMASALVLMPLKTEKGDYHAPKRTSQTSFLKWIGKVAPAGLLGVYFKKNHSNKSKFTFKALVLYRDQGYLDYLKKAVDNKTPFTWDGSDFSPEMTLANYPGNPGEFTSNPEGQKQGMIFPFAASLGWSSKYLIQAGAMSLQDHDAYQREAAVLRPGEVNEQQGKYGLGYFGELAEVNGSPLQVWALTALSNGAALSLPAANGDGEKAKAQVPASALAAGSISANSTAASTPRASGATASETAMSTAPTPQEPVAEGMTVLAQLSPEECELQVRYFGTADPNDPVHCLTCGKLGHMADVCPSKICELCQAVDLHFPSNCPTRAKCKKCRERGHKTEDCTSKLFRSKLEGTGCDLCQSKDHFEEECTWVWRTFDPDQLPHVHKVERLSVGCYFCGSDAHWGDDCGMQRSKKTHLFDVFSAKEAARYLIDPAVRPANGTANGGISIRGSAQGNPIDLDDDDEDDHMANFYRSNARAPRGGGGGHARGSIRINAGGNQRNNNNQRRSRSPPSSLHRGGANSYRQRNDNQFQPINNGYHSLPPNPYGPPVSASRGGGQWSGGRGGGQVLGRGGARNGRGGGGGARGGGGGGRGGGVNHNQHRAPHPPPPPPSAGSSRGRSGGGGGGGGGGYRKNRNKK